MVGEKIVPLRWGLLAALLTLVYGFGLGMTFGVGEDRIKEYLDSEATGALETAYGGDTAKAKAVVHSGWVYFKRAHLHANGLGTTALTLIFLLALLPGSLVVRQIAAAMSGVGALGYSASWMLAGMRAPGLGSTHAARESLAWLALPSAFFCGLGLLLTLALFLRKIFWANVGSERLA